MSSFGYWPLEGFTEGPGRRCGRFASRKWLMCLVFFLTLTGCGDGNGPLTRKSSATAQLSGADIALNNRGVALMGQFDYAGAFEVLSELVEKQPHWLDARTNLAIAAMNRQETGDGAFALEQLHLVLSEKPDDLRAHYVAGVLKLYLGDVETAARHFEAVIAGDPSDAFAQYYLGRCRGLLDDGQDHEKGALAAYEKAIEEDPYLRSAYFGAAQTLQQLGRREEAAGMLASFERLANNPRARLAEFKYTRMGPKSLALAVGRAAQTIDEPARPAGPLFGSERTLVRFDPVAGGAHLTTVDLYQNGSRELFVAGATRNRLLALDGKSSKSVELPWSRVGGIEAVAWGDIDNDGLIDLYLCRNGVNQLWMQSGKGLWKRVDSGAGIDDGGRNCADVAMVDADHDGDLDILIANRGAGDTLLNNNRDGSFRSLANKLGEASETADTQRVLTADIDGDRDVDLLFLRSRPPHVVLNNDRLWRYTETRGLDDFLRSDLIAAAVADLDADGQVELLGIERNGQVSAWVREKGDTWQRKRVYRTPLKATMALQLTTLDVTGDGRLELLLLAPGAFEVVAISDALEGTQLAIEHFSGGTPIPVVRSLNRGPSLVALASGIASEPGRDGDRSFERLLEWPPGPGRFDFVTLALSGRHDESSAVRSNASGIGTGVALRNGSFWSLTDTYKHDSLQGHSVQNLTIGLRGKGKADFVALYWSDGVLQTELDLKSGSLHHLVETERQLSSCPVLFAWDGNRYRFITDLLGVGGLGEFVEPGVAGTPRSWERLLLPPGTLAPRHGRLMLKLTEPMQENAYVDSAMLQHYDLPSEWHLVIDERMATAAPEVTGEPLFYRDSIDPTSATNGEGMDVLSLITRRDGHAMSPGKPDRHFIGLLEKTESVTLEFGRPLDAFGGEFTPVLVADAWVEYPYSQTVFSAWQAGRRYRSASLEARDASGEWHMLYPEFGYPAGMPRAMALPLPDLPPGTDALRLSWNRELYWDRIRVVMAEPPPAGMAQGSVLPRLARVAKTGFPSRTTHAQRRPDYDYQRRVPFWDTEYATGYYTKTGIMTELVSANEDALAIIGSGEELHMEFEAGTAPPDGYRRWYVLETHGWAKDKDLYTRQGETVGPLPRAHQHLADGMDGVREVLHRRYNTRFQTGR